MKYTLGSSSLDINHPLMIGCFIMLTNFSVYAYLLTLTLKKVMEEKEYKGNFPPSNFKSMGTVEC